ncbi:35627_t:CDS:2 [Gigaspora margarita]|uniref:35627_t:CDS:1 n=1 Tax=Gigaspora margarita TaxID=4874 RepID=A0ABN7W0S6_GIGMA|nr:35627_t:CDS:2 [Gigaspora margarita]
MDPADNARGPPTGREVAMGYLRGSEDIGEHLPLDELAKKLYEIELCRIAKHKRDRIPNPLVSQRASREIYEPLPISAP